MDAADLAVFAAVAGAGGMNRAAQRLHTVQSNVTQHVRRLEAELGVPLFQRHSRGVTLTAAGARLLPYAQRVGSLLEEARRAATDGAEPAGRLCIGSLETTAALRMPPILARYTAAYPRVDLVLQTGTTASLLQDVLERRLDGALVAGPIQHRALLAETVLEEHLVLLAAPGVRDLATHVAACAKGQGELKLLVFRAGCSYRVLLERYLARHGVSNMRRTELGTLDGIIGCVGAGLGLTLLPRAVVAQAQRRHQVSVHPFPASQARVPTQFVRRRDAYVSTALSCFLELARDQRARQPLAGGRKMAAGQ